jgi:hypothetical protein
VLGTVAHTEERLFVNRGGNDKACADGDLTLDFTHALDPDFPEVNVTGYTHGGGPACGIVSDVSFPTGHLALGTYPIHG